MDHSVDISDVAKIERIRQAVIKLRHEVTIGDVVSETGLSTFEVERGLKSLLGTHEGTLRVSESGELLFVFKAGFIDRDYRSWWLRSQESIYKGFKAAFKVFIMLTLVVYFVIYIAILIALLTSNRSNDSRSSSFNFNGMIWLFWGYNIGSNNSSYERKSKRVPLYTQVYQFVFGPEEAPADPLAESTRLAQLIRSKNGIITTEDWIIVSNKSRELAESDLSHYTAIFDGNAEILDDGTLVYTFAEMMKSTAARGLRPSPKPAWFQLEQRRPLSGNVESGNGLVIGLNLFNLVMAFVMMNALTVSQESLANVPQNLELYTLLENNQHYLMWLGYFPLAFSASLFTIPLLRLPGNIKENGRRRRDNVRRLAMRAINEQNDKQQTGISFEGILSRVNNNLQVNNMKPATANELKQVLDALVRDFDGEEKVNVKDAKPYYTFDKLNERHEVGQKERQTRDLRKQDLGRVIFSTDDGDVEAQKNADDIEQEDFDKRLRSGKAAESAKQRQSYQDDDELNDFEQRLKNG